MHGSHPNSKRPDTRRLHSTLKLSTRAVPTPHPPTLFIPSHTEKCSSAPGKWNKECNPSAPGKRNKGCGPAAPGKWNKGCGPSPAALNVSLSLHHGADHRRRLPTPRPAPEQVRFKIERNIGLAFVRLGQYQDALQHFSVVMDSVPDHQTGYNLL
eukprot:75824-Chlamydomonas_euryale.AAC.1